MLITILRHRNKHTSSTQTISHHRGTASRAMPAYSCYVSQGMEVIKVSSSKSDLQGHWQWCHSIGNIRLVFHCNYVSILLLTRYAQQTYFPNLKRSRDSDHIPFGGNMSCMYEYSSVSISRRNLKCLFRRCDWGNIKTNGSRDPDYVH